MKNIRQMPASNSFTQNFVLKNSKIYDVEDYSAVKANGLPLNEFKQIVDDLKMTSYEIETLRKIDSKNEKFRCQVFLLFVLNAFLICMKRVLNLF